MVRHHLVTNAFLLLIAMMSVVANAEEEYIPNVDVKQVTVNGIRLSSSEEEIVKLLGKPEKITNHGVDEVIGGKAKTFYYKGLVIYLIDQEIFGLECKGSTCITDKGIRIGDERKEVERAYGPPSEYEKTGDRLGYTFKINNKYIDSSLVFFLKNNKVIRIVYHVDYT
jgi:hypothetical protein